MPFTFSSIPAYFGNAFSSRRRAQREREREYKAQFDALKEENAKRMDRLSSIYLPSSPSLSSPSLPPSSPSTPSTMAPSYAVEALQLPSYDDVLHFPSPSNGNSQTPSLSSGSSRTTSALNSSASSFSTATLASTASQPQQGHDRHLQEQDGQRQHPLTRNRRRRPIRISVSAQQQDDMS